MTRRGKAFNRAFKTSLFFKGVDRTEIWLASPFLLAAFCNSLLFFFLSFDGRTFLVQNLFMLRSTVSSPVSSPVSIYD